MTQEFQTEFLKFSPSLSLSGFGFLEWSGAKALEERDWAKGVKIFASLVQQRDTALNRMGLAASLYWQIRLSEAEKNYLLAVEKISRPRPLLFSAYRALGEISLLKNDTAMAEEYFNKAGTLKPPIESSLFFQRSVLYLKEKRYKEAEILFQKDLAIRPHRSKAWLGLALVRRALGKDDMALACLRRCLDLNPRDEKACYLEKLWSQSLQPLTPSLAFRA